MAVDPVNDIAIIKIEGEKYPILSLGNSDNIQIGQTVIAIGNSLGEFSNTVSRGIISGLRRNVTAGNGLGTEERLNNIIQTDAAINPGNSGGPLLDIDGRVIGINVAIAQGAQNIGFAIPASQVERVVTQVKTTGKISTPFIGLRYISVDSTLQKANNLPYEYGILIVRGDRITDFAVIPGSPADKAGIVENDIILEIDGKKLDGKENTLAQIVAGHNVGDEITLKVWHRGEIKDVRVILEERK
jgi:serine protease Do